MALHTALNIQTASMAETYRHIRDFLIAANGIADYRGRGPGYVVVEESYASMDPWQPAAGDWCVMRSNGEANNWPLYLRFDHGATNGRHRIKLYLEWNTATHTGFAELYSSDNIESGAAGATLYMHADLDELHIIIKPEGNSNFYWNMIGRLKAPLYSGEAVDVEAGITAGSSTVITLPRWPAWALAGRKIYNWDGSSIHELTIAEADAVGSAITVATSYNKAPGSWLAEDFFVFVPSSSWGGAPPNLAGLPRRSGILTARDTYNGSIVFGGYTGPDAKYGDRIAMDIVVGKIGETRGRIGLARETGTITAAGTAWQDAAGKNWRLYPVYSNRYIALRDED